MRTWWWCWFAVLTVIVAVPADDDADLAGSIIVENSDSGEVLLDVDVPAKRENNGDYTARIGRVVPGVVPDPPRASNDEYAATVAELAGTVGGTPSRVSKAAVERNAGQEATAAIKEKSGSVRRAPNPQVSRL
jgi:hypothetical protein